MAGKGRNENQGNQSNRGFGSMNEDKQRDISRKSDQEVSSDDRTFSKDKGQASESSQKGGQGSHSSGRKSET